MKLTKNFVALAAALAFATVGAFAQQRNTTTTTTTTTTYVEEYEESTGVEYAEEMEEVETGTYTETRTYEATVTVPVETTKEATYTVKQGKPTTTWSAADYIDPFSFHITNTLSSDVLKLRDTIFTADDTNYASEFGGLYDTVSISYDAKRLKFQLAPSVALAEKYGMFWSDNRNGDGSGSQQEGLHRDDLGLFWNGLGWFVELAPIDILAIDFHKDTFTPGSGTLLVGNIASGNLGSSGVTAILYPDAAQKLRIAATVPFSFDISSEPNFFNAETADDPIGTGTTTDPSYKVKFNFGAGVDYKFGDVFTLGLVTKNLLSGLDGMSIGLYASITPTSTMSINLGATLNNDAVAFDYWSYADDDTKNPSAKIGGNLLINAAWGFDNGKLDTGIDALVSFLDDLGPTKSTEYENLYVGAKIGYWFIADTLHIGLNAFGAFDFDGVKAGDTIFFGIKPNLTYKVGRSTFDAAVVFEWAVPTNNFHYLKFPVSWTYRFI